MVAIDNKIRIVEEIARAWNETGVNYAVAHGLEGYPTTIGRDLDILVEPAHVPQAINLASMLLCQSGLVVVHPPPLWGERLLAIDKRILDGMIEIHTMPRLSWRNVPLVTCPKSSSQRGPFKVDPWASFAKRILTPLLAGEIHRFVHKPEELSIGESERDVVMARLQFLCGPKLAQALCGVIDQQDFDGLRILLPRLRRLLCLRAFARTPLASFWMGWRAIWRKVAQFAASCAPVIALVGPDGVGKSTLLDILSDHDFSVFTKTVVRHWRPGILPSLSTFCGTAAFESVGRATLPRRHGGHFQSLRLSYYFGDFLLGHIIRDRIDTSRQRLVLYDRCALDMNVDPGRYGLSSTRGTRLLWRLIPKPDLVILLYDDPHCIHARKAELPCEEIQRQLQTWVHLTELGAVDVIARVDGPPDEMAERVKSLIMQTIIEKNKGSVAARNDWVQWSGSILRNDVESPLTPEDSPTPPLESHQGEHNQEYGVVTLKDGRGYLIPLGARKAALRALDLYNTQNRKARIAKRLLRTGLYLGIAQPFLQKARWGVLPATPQEELINNSLLAYLKQVFGQQNLNFAASLGIPGPHRKPVLQALMPDGSILGYAKVGWNEQTNTLVHNEAQILRCLGEAHPRSFTLPTLLHEGQCNGRLLCVMSPAAAKTKAAPQVLTLQHLAVQRELAALHTSWISLKASRFRANLLQYIEAIQHPYYRHILQQGICVAEAWLGEQSLPFHLSHGDFTPWNTRSLKQHLFLFDWEYSAADNPPGYDLFHFAVQTGRLLRKEPPGRVSQSILSTEWQTQWFVQHLDYLGISYSAAKPLFLLYLLERLAFYAAVNDTDWKALKHFSMAINFVLLDGGTSQCRIV
jgi:hypothetical protein